MGILVLKPVLKYIGNSRRNRRKPVKKLRQKNKSELKKNEVFCIKSIFNKNNNLLQNAL